MKTIPLLFMGLFSIVAFGQFESGEDLLISDQQKDDIYLAGETIEINAVVRGDVVAAGGNISVNDSIYGDLTAAGGELFINQYIADDVRVSGGSITINSEIGDDLVVFGGEVILTKNAKVSGNLLCYAGDVKMNGEVVGMMKTTGADVTVNGTIQGTSKIIGEDIEIGDNARFLSDVEYWSSDGEIDFKESLVNANAQFNEDLREDRPEFSWVSFGIASLALWGFYMLSAFLVILVLHALFRKAFSKSVQTLQQHTIKSFGYGLIYLIGVPLLIAIAFMMIVGIPLGLFITTIFIFSLLFGHLIAALLLAYYVTQKNKKNWGFWSITFLALLLAIVLRVLTIIPFLGIILSVVILSFTYGALTLRALKNRNIPEPIE
ncbi:hypothetical protein ACFO3O_11900 [Dokdonia ponticola]|uniref:Polymer-forming cytoskeletal protein n=1 Tax=Dokdonia ponticola TaxID=2041041 RepID=A0ABV9HXR3_9FLAO